MIKNRLIYNCFYLLCLALLGACGSDGGGAKQAGTVDGLYDATVGGFPVLSQTPSNNQQMTSCTTLAVAAPGNLFGSVSYERRPMGRWSGLLPEVMLKPARGIAVEAVAVVDGNCAGQILATTLTDGNGDYGLNVPANTAVCVRARAQLIRLPGNGGANWNIQVTDNTRGNTAYYLEHASMAAVEAEPVRELVASAGWDVDDYTTARTAAPFAILDTVCDVLDVLVNSDNGLEKSSTMPALLIRWSINNTVDDGEIIDGDIGTAFFRIASGVNELFLRGDKDINSDEYDPHVIAHEMAHYITASFLRSDSLGGEHSLASALDLSTAFEEGWANAFAAIALEGKMVNGNERLFRDSRGDTGLVAGGFYLDKRDNFEVSPGWFSEGSVHRILYNLYDTNNSLTDRESYSLATLYAALKLHVNTDALTSIFSFSQAFFSQAVVAGSDLPRVMQAEDIYGSGDFALNETNDGGNVDALPVFTVLEEGLTQRLCSNNDAGIISHLANYRYLSFNATMNRDYQFTIKPAGDLTESDGVAVFDVLERGQFYTSASISSSPGSAIEVNFHLQQGRYVLTVAHYDNVIEAGASPGRKCFDVTVY